MPRKDENTYAEMNMGHITFGPADNSLEKTATPEQRRMINRGRRAEDRRVAAFENWAANGCLA
jgi:hypothetical protein